MATTPVTPPARAAEQLKRLDNLALIFQEVLTVVARLRANRQRFNDVETFRSQIRNALKTAENDGLRRGYSLEDLRVATFAVVAFLDESILNSQNAVFIDWQRKPLQEELFGVHVAGEIFFRNVERLLSRQDSEPLADLLEIHQLCLLLGFRGRYSAGSTSGDIRNILQQIEEKIRRIRGGITMPAWQPPAELLAPPRDKWIPVLKWLAIGCATFAVLLFVVFKLLLSSAAGDLSTLASRVSF